jgi:MFS superfamily sulfate permease-like transporter
LSGCDIDVDPASNLPEAYPVLDSLPVEVQKHIFVYSFHGPLFFGEVTNLEKLLEQVPGAKHIILHFSNVPFADLSGAFALQDALRGWSDESIDVLAVKLLEPTRSTLENLGIRIPNCYDTVGDAIAHIAFGDIQKPALADAQPVDHDV